MPNGRGLTGMLGSSVTGTSAQGAVSFRFPGSSTKYMMFNNAAIDGNQQGVRWTEIDMSLAGNGSVSYPFGDVTANKDVERTPGVYVTEIMGTYSSSCDGYWVVSHENKTDRFISIKVTSAGPQPPVHTSAGPTASSMSGRGSIKISSDGLKLVMAGGWPTFINVFDFNATTGIVSNPEKIGGTGLIDYGYGIQWSPSNEYVYVSGATPQTGIFGYNLTTKTTFMVNSDLRIGDLEMAPDGKIYGASASYGNKLVSISNPDDGYTAVFDASGYSLLTATGNYGLPASYSCSLVTSSS